MNANDNTIKKQPKGRNDNPYAESLLKTLKILEQIKKVYKK